jgi:lipopolysaccharide export system permease protein
MIFVRTTLREFTAVGIAVFLVLLVITVTTQLIKLLGAASGGSIPSDAVLVLSGFSVLGYLAVLLSLTLFLSVLLSVTRASRDSEMVVWQSSGLGLASWLVPVSAYAAPIIVLVAVLSFYLMPWTFGKIEQYKHQLENRDDVAAVAPGVFKESKNGERVLFVDKVSSDLRQVANIFVHITQDQRQGVMVANRGYAELRNRGERYLVLVAGRRYEGTPGQADYKVTNFERYSFRIEQKEATAFLPSQKSLATRQLIENPTPLNLSELTWRVGLPVSALLMAFLAIPLSAVNPRTGRLLNVLVGGFLYMVYSNLISISQAWVAKGTLKPALGMFGVHAIMLILLCALFYRRIFGLWLRWRT